MNKILVVLLMVIVAFGVNSCSNKSNNTSMDEDKIEYSSTDYVRTYWIIRPGAEYKAQRVGYISVDDLVEGSSLLFTQNGIVKAIEFAEGWRKVTHFNKHAAFSGQWWKYVLYYETDWVSPWTGKNEEETTVFVPI